MPVTHAKMEQHATIYWTDTRVPVFLDTKGQGVKQVGLLDAYSEPILVFL